MSPKITINNLRIVIAAFFCIAIISSCNNFSKLTTYPKKKKRIALQRQPFIYNNTINLEITGITKDENKAILSRLQSQIEDSAKVSVIDKAFVMHVINNPVRLDTAAIAQSAYNMRSSLVHLGYYNASATSSYYIDSSFKASQNRVYVTYNVKASKPTRIETMRYNLRKNDLQKIANDNINESLLKINNPVAKANVLGEVSRLVELYRNNGYYKFTSDELRIRGDTTIEALTNLPDDPFEQLEALQRAQAKRDSPTIKLAMVLVTPQDSSRLMPYHVNNIYILTDYKAGDKIADSTIFQEMVYEKKCDSCRGGNVYIRSHYDMFKNEFVLKNLRLFPGDLLRQNLYYETLNNFNRAGVWGSYNISIVEKKGNDFLADIIIQLIPVKQFDFESSLEFSYSSNSNSNNVTVTPSGNLLGIIANAALTNKNLWRQGIRSTTSLSTGIELNLKNRSNTNEFVNSNDIRVSQSFFIPKFLFPQKYNVLKSYPSKNTFLNFNGAYTNRISLFKLKSLGFTFGYTFVKPNQQLTLKPINIQYSNVYDETPEFITTLTQNPYLRYAFNTALVAGIAGSFTKTWLPKIKNKNVFNFNGEASFIPLIKNNLYSFIKTDFEYTHAHSEKKWAVISRGFIGVGVASKSDNTLPFFKQYSGGGSNSMRGWPVRGIGLGSQLLKPYGTSLFNDRTGDIQLEANIEYRGDIAKAFGDVVFFKYAFFADLGNTWNLRNSKTSGIDTAQFKFKYLARDLGLSVGTGLRMDFTYFVIRLDMGFRIKRPETSYINNGWKLPTVGFDDVLKKLFSRGVKDINGINDNRYRKWRYENYNFTLGINYPF